MSITRGEFLKSLRKSIPGMVLGGGVATAASKLLGRMAAASGATETEIPSPTSSGNQTVAELTPSPQDAGPDFITHGPPDGNRVALTFDDGPTPGVTDRILDTLQKRKLHATFFMIGERIATAPELARRVLAEGHEVGNHTFTHPNLTKLPDAQVEGEIQKAQDIMIAELQHCARWFRPPYGAFRRNQVGLPAKRGLRVVLWSVDPADWSQPGEEKIAGTVLAETKPGSIVICHDLHAQTANSLGAILDGFEDRGFRPVTLSGLLG